MNENEQKTATPDPKPAGDNSKLFGILSYIGPLVIISYFSAKNNPFVKFHIKQGLVLFVIDILIWLLGNMTFGLMGISRILSFCVFILAVIGIYNVINHREQELPIVGRFSRYFKF